MKWDTDTGKWVRPFKRPEPVAKIQPPAIPEAKPKDLSKMDWEEVLFDIYKNCRNLPNWETLKTCHDEFDQACFENWDRLTLR
jgi:hypothetical protein